MDQILIIALITLVLFYPLKLAFAEFIKFLAKKEIQCFELKVNRMVEIKRSEDFKEILIPKAGTCLLHEHPENSKEYQRFHYKLLDGKFVPFKLKRERPWLSERDKWQLVEFIKHDFEPITRNMNWFQKWCYYSLAIYWYGGWLFENNISYKPLNINKVVQRKLIGADGKPVIIDGVTVMETTLAPVVPEGEESKYLFTGDTEYGFLASKAEDSTGNPVDLYFSLIGACVNGYVARVDNERWDDKQRLVATDTALKIIKEKPFVSLNIFLRDLLKEKGVKISKEEKAEDITKYFCEEMLKAMNETNDGFLYSRVTIIAVDPSDPKLRAEILKVVASRIKLIVTQNEAEGEEFRIKTVEGAKNAMYEQKMQITAQNKQAAAISQMDTFKNLKVLSVDGREKNIFTATLGLGELDEDDQTPTTPINKKETEEKNEE